MATITQTAIGDDRFNILVGVLQFIDANVPGSTLVTTLDTAGANLTVFAPTDSAFGQLAADLGFVGDVTDEAAVSAFLTSSLPATTLNDVVTYHVASGVLTAADVVALPTISTLNGAVITQSAPVLIDLEPDLINPSLIATDIVVDNGIIHAIDRVLLPVDLPGNDAPTIAGIVAASGTTFDSDSADFDILLTALQTAGLVDTFNTPGDSFTVLAPNDAAFIGLAQSLGFTGSDESGAWSFIVDTLTTLSGGDPSLLLTEVLTYHVVAGSLQASQVLSSASLTTFQSGEITVSGTTLIDADPDLTDPTIIATDIQASNGIVHVIDNVLLPIDVPDSPAPAAPTITGIVASSGGEFDTDATDFDLLLSAVQTAGLAGTLDDPNADLTVFAPNDAAFVGLAQTLGYGGSDEAGAWAYTVDALTLLGSGDPIPLLTSVLTYHVVPGALQASAVLAATSLSTLQGGTIGVSGTTLVDADSDIADPGIVATDIAASNGVVHVIDGVLLPADLLVTNGLNDVRFEIGSDASEFLVTGRDNDFVSGKGGNDTIITRGGDDVAIGGAGRDKIFTGRGDDVAIGGDGRDKIFTKGGDDSVDGGAGRDRIFSGWGDDTVDAGSGRDIIFLGSGADTLIFKAGNEKDRVVDFRKGQDKIDVSDFGFSDISEVTALGDTGFFKSVYDFGNGDVLVINGFGVNGLGADDFILA